jgi:hypothetical protein
MTGVEKCFKEPEEFLRRIIRSHKYKSSLRYLSKEGRSAVLKYIKVSLQDLSIASAPPFAINFCNCCDKFKTVIRQDMF